MPRVKNLAAGMFGRFPQSHINPDEPVALGAAVQAGLKERDAAFLETVITDICPDALGVEVCEEMQGSGNLQTGRAAAMPPGHCACHSEPTRNRETQHFARSGESEARAQPGDAPSYSNEISSAGAHGEGTLWTASSLRTVPAVGAEPLLRQTDGCHEIAELLVLQRSQLKARTYPFHHGAVSVAAGI